LDTLNLVWLLLPVAAACGWWAAVRSLRKPSPKSAAMWHSPACFRGLHHVLNEEPDKAIAVFSEMLAVDNETIETHLVLGSLFRQRGELERAVRVHQNLLARPALKLEQQAQVLLELGRDYMQAGLLDRAEAVFQDLRTKKQLVPEALQHLRTIFQQEKDWLACLQTSEALEKVGGEDLSLEKSHFFCELAAEARQTNQMKQAKRYLQRALAMHRNCVRAQHLLGQIAWQAGQSTVALRYWHATVKQDPAYLPELWSELLAAHRALGSLDTLQDILVQACAAAPELGVELLQAELIQQRAGREQAALFLASYVQQSPSVIGVAAWLKQYAAEGSDPTQLRILSTVLQRLLAQKTAYQCSQCGFQARALHWQCPRCLTWSTVRRRLVKW